MSNVCVISFLVLTNLFSHTILESFAESYEGLHTPDIKDYEVVIPARADWEGNRVSFHIPQYYDRGSTLEKRKRRSVEQDDIVHYLLHVGDRRYHLELEPNFNLMSPGLVIEDFSRNGSRIRRASYQQCHYIGSVKGEPNSSAALSVCNGMTGYVTTGADAFYIEPAKGVEPDSEGKHIHLAHRKRRNAEESGSEFCGTHGDWEQLMKERLKREIAKDPDFLSKLKRRAASKSGEESLPRYMEVAIVVDKKFIDFYNGTGIDMQQYILTSLNVAARFFHDASIGNLMIFSVVRVMYLYKQEEEMDLQINTHAPNTLASFCKWQIHLNPKEESHPNHHDFAVLLTRYDICNAQGNCAVNGLAYVAQACNPEMSCAIIEDSGVSMGNTIAHELGHVLSCEHDTKEETGCNNMAPEGWGYVMTPITIFFTLSWSKCSKQFVTEFLNAYLGECLLDEPTDHEWDIPDMPPGVMYSMDDQCKLVWKSSNSKKACPFPPDKLCDKLWCIIPSPKGRSCSTYGNPPYHGTKCDKNKWCYLLKCVPVGNRSIAVDGGWGEWSPPTPCSRTCGGGVSKQERQCNNPSPLYLGKYCVGQRYKYSMCNTEPCPFDKRGVRTSLCSQFDGKNELGQKTNDKWTEFGVVDYLEDLCALYCESKNQARILMKRVPDGIPCKAGSRSRCIAGKCRDIGCDWQVDSKVNFDNCRVCGGGDKNCKFFEIIRKKDYEVKKTGGAYYTPFFIIPADARNVLVKEVDESRWFYFIVRNKSNPKEFYIGQSMKRDNAYGERHFGEGVMGLFLVTGKKKEIIIPGPTNHEIEVGYIRDRIHESTDIVLQYYMLSNDSTDPKYTWEHVEWSECSALCEGGTQVSEAKCVGTGVAEDRFCNLEDKPKTESRTCNNVPCPIKWKTSTWGPCEGCVGEEGTQRRSVVCIQQGKFKNAPDVLLDEEKCKEEKPEAEKKCQVEKVEQKQQKSSLCPERDFNKNTGFLGVDQENLIKQSLYKEGEFFRNVESHLKNTGTSPSKKDEFHNFYKIKRKKKFPLARIGMYEIATPRVIVEAKPPIVVKSIPLEERDKKMVLSDEILETLGHRVLISKTHNLDIKNNETIEGLEALNMLAGSFNTSSSP